MWVVRLCLEGRTQGFRAIMNDGAKSLASAPIKNHKKLARNIKIMFAVVFTCVYLPNIT